MIVLAVLVYLAKILGGFLLAHLIWDARDAKSLLFKFFLGVGVGTGISAVLYFFWMWIQLPAGFYPYFELSLLLLLLLTVFLREKRRPVAFVPINGQALLWTGLVALAVAFSVVSFLLRALPTPHGVQDAWGIWNVSARFIYGAGAGWLKIIPQNAWFHPDYPLLVSLNIAEVWSIVGASITRVPIIFALVYMLALIGLLSVALAIVKDNQQGAFGAILLASAPVTAFLASNQYADVPLAYFFLGTAALFYMYSLLRETRLLVFAGLFAGLAAWTKNEGLTYLLMACLLCAVLSVREKKKLFVPFLVGLALPLLALLLFKSIAPGNDLFTQFSASLLQFLDFPRYLTIAGRMLMLLATFGGWPVSFAVILAGYALLVFVPHRPAGKRWLVGALLVGQLLSYFAIYLFTPADVTLHINTSLERLFFHLFPLAIFFILIFLPSPRTIFAKE